MTGERREQNTLINDIRREVERVAGEQLERGHAVSRASSSPTGRDPDRETGALLPAEAAETAIFLAEVAGRHGTADYRRRIEPENDVHNDGLPRVALKMATGTGKTVVMAMLIAWQTDQQGAWRRAMRASRSGSWSSRPGITIRDRLGVLQPERE